MGYMGGGERLCCDTIRALSSSGHQVTLLSASFESKTIEDFFGYEGLFDKVTKLQYPTSETAVPLGANRDILSHVRGQRSVLSKEDRSSFDLIFSTQDPRYVPDASIPVVQWGYYGSHVPKVRERRTPPRIARSLATDLYYREKISRLALVLAISQFSKESLDREWKRPSILVYPACNMVTPLRKQNMVVTVARAIPEKRLEIFWKVASLCPSLNFVMLLTQDKRFQSYFEELKRSTPSNGQILLNPVRTLYHKVLGEARVYLHLMENEHFGITVVEAMSAGCVPIVHDSGGPREIVTEQAGFRWKSIQEIPQLVTTAMSKPETGEIATERAESFNYEVFERKLSSIFSELQTRIRK